MWKYLISVTQGVSEAGSSTAVVSFEQLQLGQIEEVGNAATTFATQQLLGQSMFCHLTTQNSDF